MLIILLKSFYNVIYIKMNISRFEESYEIPV